MPNFSDRLKELRTQSGITLKDLADRLGISSRMVYYLEAGQREPNLDTIANLCDLFNVSSDYLLGKSDKPNIDSVTLEMLYKDMESEFQQPLSDELKESIKKYIELRLKNKKDT
jgi:transcriptional regulator with XRE-family HTH domain